MKFGDDIFESNENFDSDKLEISTGGSTTLEFIPGFEYCVHYEVQFELVNGGRLPEYAHEGDAGADAFANTHKVIQIEPGSTAKIPLGIKAKIPEGFEIQVRPKSGLAAKEGLTILNSPGTIDSGYRGEIIALVHNTSNVTSHIVHGQKICQLVYSPTYRMNIVEVDSIENDSTRGEGGFGSTGR